LRERVRVVETSLRRIVDLLGKRNLEPGTGLLFVPSRALDTVATCFAIDVVLLDRSRRDRAELMTGSGRGNGGRQRAGWHQSGGKPHYEKRVRAQLEISPTSGPRRSESD
jgi:hypothetical protein